MSVRSYDRAKRAIDVVAATVGLVLTGPIQAVVALLVRQHLGRPVIFVQERPGQDGRLFKLYKFRTMRSVEQAGGTSDAVRLTRLGTWLRRTSLDEMPSLINVLRGDMSLVGPRPLLVSYLQRYDAVQARRHDVRPGLTGLAQVNGRNALPWEQRLAFDVEYVERRSLSLDLRILLRTVSLVLRGQGVTDGVSATSAEFHGNGAPSSGSRPARGSVPTSRTRG